MSDSEKEQPKTIFDFLQELPNPPSQETIAKWKEKFGDIYVSGFEETELFIFRPLSRKEYLEIQKAPRTEPVTELDLQEFIVEKCILYSSNESALALKAGTFATLSEQIMDKSNFKSPGVAAASVLKL